MSKWLSTILVVTILAIEASAQWSGDPTINTPVCTASSLQRRLQIVSDDSGGTILVWTDSRNGASDIYAQRIDPSGQIRWSQNGVAICSSSGEQDFACIVADGSGGAIIAWPDSRNGPHYDIYAQRINKSGTPQWAADGVIVSTAHEIQEAPTIVSDGAKGAIVAWADRRSYTSYDIYAQLIDSVGDARWAPDGIPVFATAADERGPLMVSNLLGGAIIVSGRLAQNISGSGSFQWDAAGVQVANGRCNTIITDGRGGAIVAWEDGRSGLSDIYAQRFNGAGVLQWGGSGAAVCNATNLQQYPTMVSDGSGGVLVCWQDLRSSSNFDVFCQRMDSTGGIKWVPDGVPVCQDANSQYYPKIESDAAGGGIITWAVSTGAGSDIYARRISIDGTARWRLNGVPICVAQNDQYSPVIAVGAAGGAIIAWEDLRNSSDGDVYVQRVESTGSLPTPSIGWVAGTTPSRNEINVPQASNITIRFTEAINPITLSNNSIKVSGSLSGLHPSDVTYDAATRSATINPTMDFSIGEVVTVTLTNGIQNLIGDPMSMTQCSGFTVVVPTGSGAFSHASNVVTDNDSRQVAAGDFDGDQDVDLAVTNYTSNRVSIVRNNGSGGFNLASSITISRAVHIKTADFDSDGDLDLAVVSFGGSISILKNNGSGAFTQTSTPSVGSNPGQITVGDFDSDGDVDIAVVKQNSGEVMLLNNGGSGTFTQASPISLGNNPTAIVCGDLDSDGDLDLVVTMSPSTVATLKNDGTGSFSITSNAPTGTGANGLAIGDVDIDGDLDIAVTNYSSNNVIVYANNGSGVLAQLSVVGVGTQPYMIEAGDLDGDGDLDLAAVNGGLNTVSVLTNNGGGTFTQTSTPIAGTWPNSLAISDLDGDRNLDLAVVVYGTNGVSILKNLTREPLIASSTAPLQFGLVRSNSSKSLQFRLFNRGGRDTLRVTSITASSPEFQVGQTSCAIARQDSLTINVMFTPTEAVTFAESLTVVSNDTTNPTLTLQLSGTGTPTVTASVPNRNSHTSSCNANDSVWFNAQMQSSTLSSSSFFIYGDISGRHTGAITYDAAARIATFDPSSDFIPGEKVQVVLTSAITSAATGAPLVGGHAFKYGVPPSAGSGIYTLDTSYSAGTTPFGAAVGDFNGDGFSDYVVANSGSTTVSVFLNSRDGRFNSAINYTVGTSPQGVCVADINGDFHPDIVSANSSSNNVSVLLNNGGGGFGPSTNYAVGSSPRSIAAADLNNDGRLDVAVGNVSSNEISVLRNAGSGTFSAAVNMGVGTAPSGLILEDLNSDGFVDIAVADRGSNHVAVLPNNGDGTFTSAFVFAVGSAPNSLIANDLDNDGDVDLATANGTSNNISLLFNNGNATFPVATNVEVGANTQPIALYANDLNHDGAIDLAVANLTSSDVVIFLNNGNGTLAAGSPATLGSGVGPRAIVGLDVGNNGGLHLLVANILSNEIRLLRDVVVGLPVQLASFTARVVDAERSVRLAWMTVSETNNFGFEVEKRGDSTSTFMCIPNSFVAGHGTTLEPHSYMFTDTLASRGTWQYRLRQIDLDGTVHFSDGVSVSVMTGAQIVAAPTIFVLHQNYPNPFNPSTQIEFDLPQASHVSLAVYDILGRKIAELVNGQVDKGYHSATWDASGFASGVYFARFTANDGTGTVKLNRVSKLLLSR